MSSLDAFGGGAPGRRRLRRLARSAVASETGTAAAAIAHQMMFAFFPALLLLKSAQDCLGLGGSRWTVDPHGLGIEIPGAVLGLVNDFIGAAHGLTGDARPLAELGLALLVLKGLTSVFEEYVCAFHALTGAPYPFLHRKLVAGATAAFALLAAFALFARVNAVVGSAPAPARGLLLALALVMLLGGVAGFFRLLTHGLLSRRAVLGAAGVGVLAWSAGTTLFFRIEFDFAEEQRLYGAAAAVVALLLWFHVTARLLLARG